MDNESGADGINSLFTNKFKDLYNSVGFENNELELLISNINESIEDNHTNSKLMSNYKYLISVNDVNDAICKLKADKKEENGLNTNHFKAGSTRLNIEYTSGFNLRNVLYDLKP